MVRKILGGTLMALSSLLLVLSLIGIGAAWYYNQPVTEEIVARIGAVDAELAGAQEALQNAETELERAQRIVDSAEAALQALSEQTSLAVEILDTVEEALDENINPSLENTKDKIDQAREALEELRASVEQINRIPFVNLELPGEDVLTYLIETAESLEAEVVRVEAILERASTLVDDSSYLLGADLSETRENIQELLEVVVEYETKVSAWRAQLSDIGEAVPAWIDRASIFLTFFLFWFGLSQVSVFLHGLAVWRGGDVLEVVRKSRA